MYTERQFFCFKGKDTSILDSCIGIRADPSLSMQLAY